MNQKTVKVTASTTPPRATRVSNIATGILNGRKQSLTWCDGILEGDADAVDRFMNAWQATDRKTFHENLPKHEQAGWARILVRKILMEQVFDEVPEMEAYRKISLERLQEWADSWNSHEAGRNYTAADMREIEERVNRAKNQGPPYSWKEIEVGLQAFQGSTSNRSSEPPTDIPTCFECLKPMEWIWYQSPPETWTHLCGRAGWVPICRRCKTWRKCRIRIMN